MIIYAGLSMDAKTLKKTNVKAKLLPPIRRTQIYRDFKAGERVFLIADGEFDQTLAVSAGEILDVLRAGGIVFGSSSIGALRAAEMEAFGMFGIGEIFDLVRNTPVFRDDWLGHMFDPDTLELLTLPFIEVIFLAKPYLKGSLAEWGERVIREHPFAYDALTKQRCLKLIDWMNLRPQDKETLSSQIQDLFTGKRMSQKKKDALAMIKMAKEHLISVQKFNRHLQKRCGLY